MIWGKKEIMKYATTNKDSFALQTFKELSKTIESDNFKSQLRDIIKTINIQGFFEIHQDIYDLAPNTLWKRDMKEKLSKKHWFSLVDYLKEKISLYELHSDKDWVKNKIKEKLKILSHSENINRFFRYDISKACISFDIKEKNLLFTRKTNHSNISCQLENNTGKVNTHTLVLFEFSFLKEGFDSLIDYLDDDLIMLFFKNICRLLSDDDFADSLIIYIRNNLNNLIEEWTLNSIGDDLKLDIFPIDFYSPEFVSKIKSKKNYSDFFKNLYNIEEKQKCSILNFYEIKKYYKNFLTQVIEDCVDPKMYPSNRLYTSEVLSLSDKQIAKLKSELIPLLEEIERQDKIFFEIYGGFSYTKENSGSKNFIKHCCNCRNDEGIIPQLIELLDWYPKKFNFYQLIFTKRHLNEEIKKYSHIKYASKTEGFDYHIYIELCKYDNKEKWPEKRFNQIQNIANKILGNATVMVTERGLGRNIPEPLKIANLYDFYNNDIHPKYRFKK